MGFRKKRGAVVILLVVMFVMALTGCGKYNVVYVWPTCDVADLIPIPESEYGEIGYERDNSFGLYVYKVTRDQYDDYVIECQDAGFNSDYSRGTDHYYAYDEAGDYLRLQYTENKKILKIELIEGNKEEEEEIELENDEEEIDILEEEIDDEAIIEEESDEETDILEEIDKEEVVEEFEEPKEEIEEEPVDEEVEEEIDILEEDKVEYDIDQDLLIFSIQQDSSHSSRYYIVFADYDNNGMLIELYTFKNSVNPRDMGDNFDAIGGFPSWFYEGAEVHIQANMSDEYLSTKDFSVVAAK